MPFEPLPHQSAQRRALVAIVCALPAMVGGVLVYLGSLLPGRSWRLILEAHTSIVDVSHVGAVVLGISVFAFLGSIWISFFPDTYDYGIWPLAFMGLGVIDYGLVAPWLPPGHRMGLGITLVLVGGALIYLDAAILKIAQLRDLR